MSATPRNETGFATAGFWRRVLAFGFDAALVGTVTLFLGLAVGVIDFGAFPTLRGNLFDYLVDVWNGQPWLLLGPVVLFGALLVAYDTATLSVLGRSPGRRALGIEIVGPQGGRPGPGRAALRAALRLVSFLALGLGVLWVAAHRERRAWHDLLCGTFAGRRSS